MRAAVVAAIPGLLGLRDDDGWWRDYRTLAGVSDEWITACAGTSLALSGSERGREAALGAWRRLRTRRRWTGGWAYSRSVPVDADSTAWGLRLAGELGRGESPSARRAVRRLRRHVGPDGGVRTFRRSGPVRAFTGLSGAVSFQGWCRPHPSVTALAAHLPVEWAGPGPLDSLRLIQREDGSWPTYWWEDPAYGTWLAASALARSSGEPGDRDRVRRAARWASERARRDGSREETPTFSLGCLAATAWLGEAFDRKAGRAAALRVAGRQRADGTWEGSARLRIPPPDETEPEQRDRWFEGGGGGGSVQADRAGCFTTACLLAALRPMARHRE